MARSLASKERRLSRYHYLLDRGYRAVDARRLRDQSATNIRADVSRVERRITIIRPTERTVPEREQLSKIRRENRKIRQRPSDRQFIEPRVTRLANFSRWSGERNFPTHIQRVVERINLDAGFDPFHSYGYRVFYHRYVNGVSEIEAISRVERRDT